IFAMPRTHALLRVAPQWNLAVGEACREARLPLCLGSVSYDMSAVAIDENGVAALQCRQRTHRIECSCKFAELQRARFEAMREPHSQCTHAHVHLLAAAFEQCRRMHSAQTGMELRETFAADAQARPRMQRTQARKRVIDAL